jgi:hypothetical protein
VLGNIGLVLPQVDIEILIAGFSRGRYQITFDELGFAGTPWRVQRQRYK